MLELGHVGDFGSGRAIGFPTVPAWQRFFPQIGPPQARSPCQAMPVGQHRYAWLDHQGFGIEATEILVRGVQKRDVRASIT